jgi:hypothetical protein
MILFNPVTVLVSCLGLELSVFVVLVCPLLSHHNNLLGPLFLLKVGDSFFGGIAKAPPFVAELPTQACTASTICSSDW